MLNTQNILRAAALLGTCALATARQVCDPAPSQVHTIPSIGGQESQITKLRAGVVLTPGVNELLALQGTDLLLVRDVMSAPRAMVVAHEVVDFAVLPAVNGLSEVVVVGPEGLRISTRLDGSSDGPTLSFNTVLSNAWEAVTLVDAARIGGMTTIIGAEGSELRRGKYDSTNFAALPSIQAEGQILKLAIADTHSQAGLEVALHSSGGVGLFFENSAIPYIFLPGPSSACVAIDRIPHGAGVRDSFGLWVRDPATDMFFEVVEGQFSAPIVGGAWRAEDVSYGAIGIQFQPQLSTLETDMAVLTQTNELIAMHGVPQAPGSVPFSFETGQFWFHSLPTLLGQTNLGDLRIACADFDGDGDGDIAIANSGDDVTFSFVRNDCSYADPAALVRPVVMETPSPAPIITFTAPTAMGVSTWLGVRQPPIFEGAVPTHVRVKVYIREYYDAPVTQAPVSPDVWWEGDLDVFAGVQVPGSNDPHSAHLDFDEQDLPNSLIGNGQLTTENVLAYFEFVPLRKDPVSGEVIQRANATVWVGSMEADLLTALICNDDPDEFSMFYPPCGLVYGGSGQLITDMHRRKVIRPIPPSQVPQ